MLEKLLIPASLAALTAVIGYLVGSIKHFKDQQFKFYMEALPVLLKFAYKKIDLKNKDSEEMQINRELAKIWLLADKDIAIQWDKVFSIKVKPERGKLEDEIPKAILLMREELHPIWRYKKRKLDKKDIKHLYVKFVENKK